VTRRCGLTSALLAVGTLVLLCLCACSTFYTRYFQRLDSSEIRLGGFRLSPRIFAYQEEKTGSPRVLKGVFTVTVRVEDAESAVGDYEWQAEQTVIDSLAEKFLQKVVGDFVVDSLVLHQIPGSRPPIILKPDSINYAPRRENFLTLRFGETEITSTTEGLRVVLHVTRPERPPVADSAVFMMVRVEREERGLMMLKNKVHGY
jgi:hypothetical protein